MTASIAAIRARAAFNQRIRRFFEERNFVEVETPAIALSPGLETHLDAVAVSLREGMAGELVERWLITSPEYHCKRLLSRGMERIYRFGKAFRSGERGVHHNPEFTMLEWYRAHADYREIVTDTIALIDVCNAGQLALQPPLFIGFDELIAEHVGVDCLVTDDTAFVAAASRAAMAPYRGETAADLLMRAWVERVEPNLPRDRVVVIDRYPARLASLARLCSDDPRIAERVEIYLCGVELANGFSELVDAAEQRRRFEADLSQRRLLGLAEPPIDERFLAALDDCPNAAGIALGVDRLLMVLAGYERLDEVIAFPFEVA